MASPPVFFFDIDNCLYHPSTGIMFLMKDRIYAYGQKIGIPTADVKHLCESYYRDYGLAVRGLLKHHVIDPVDYDRQVDGALPLEDILKPDPALRQMLQAARVRRLAFTNAGKDHAHRVLRCLGIEDLFETVIYCDYASPQFTCKPEVACFHRAMQIAGVSDPDLCYFVDDSADNVKAARNLGWHSAHLCPTGDSNAGEFQIQNILDLPNVFPQFWPTNDSSAHPSPSS
ncbi:suppressor of deletion of TFIIS [Dimargaris cristalligena]|uniref:SSM1 protein n=1 Tax=Dimargaris cristalligena TaxID=215637 RepID=A0A4V1J4P9_9FUNG|nr:suppressor of deletion of TFIIS [Dimargaris cristalligena]RKP36319.1 SSM1 protein [Dimargaris cristalligena]|eukprot:RKP36319.1 SSM1 protein [Dimargaris cristalligena]